MCKGDEGNKKVDITERVVESSEVTGRLREFEWMMKTNKEPYIWKGREGNGADTRDNSKGGK
ncbi:MAG TPA: hypothetical protein VFD33_02440 [Bacillota bacterium]|nr:hypothetical protein [Bacillota bacterium]